MKLLADIICTLNLISFRLLWFQRRLNGLTIMFIAPEKWAVKYPTMKSGGL